MSDQEILEYSFGLFLGILLGGVALGVVVTIGSIVADEIRDTWVNRKNKK